MYISYSQEMTREFIDACAMWARAFSDAALAVDEFLFDDSDRQGERSIQAFRIRFASGFEILALSSAPRTLRGKQGVVIIDEAAFVDNLKELLKAALAFLMWGGQVVVCSTHNGTDNEFNVQIQEILGGRSKYDHIRIDFDQALQDGLYQRICLVTGREWSPEAEARWRQEIIDFYGDGADEELFCVPDAGHRRLADGAADRGAHDVADGAGPPARTAARLPAAPADRAADAWWRRFMAELETALERARPEAPHALGFDFGRVSRPFRRAADRDRRAAEPAGGADGRAAQRAR